MREPDDWRLTNQQNYLHGITLYWKTYTRYREGWDHDHCSFCWAKFMVEDYSDVLHEGYASAGDYWWICRQCFDDFQDLFEWKVVNEDQVA